ncbi:MFS transporter [Corynebacterium sp. sy017]|uniref:MFS transporter n=1 Tax=unclassified Corynebacterium TaxID=2624378 RepID=UPI0011848FB5|nr:MULTISPECIES: MFS transporter [unclassified Corynebacterium]MBP3087538.1 MFS transporter [Corynebacterium sp. sy017]TSD92116.1 MFS transporter [Corynebacterium sp. SY003]
MWTSKNYRLLMAGQTVSVIGNQVTSFALLLVVLHVTGSSATAGVISGLCVLSMVVFGLPIGQVVDRFSRLYILRLSATVGIIGSLLCVWATEVDFSVVLFCFAAVLLGVVSSAFGTAERAFLKEIVEPSLLAKAMAVNQGRYSVGVLVGPLLAGMLLSVSDQAPFWVDAVSFVWVLCCVMLICPIAVQQKTGV